MNLQKGGVVVRLSNDFLQRLKDSVNINDIIGSYVDLKKKGRYYFASCPFHGPEKTPSFQCLRKKDFIIASAVTRAGTSSISCRRWKGSLSWRP